jgi:signal transduction histidine kinase
MDPPMTGRLNALMTVVAQRSARYLTKSLIFLVTLALLVVTALSRDRDLRTDLKYDLATASAQLSPLFAGYRLAGEYKWHEVLGLSREELNHAVATWPRVHAAVYLQVFNTRDKLYIDSRTREVQSYDTIDPVSLKVRNGSWREGRPFLYADWDLSGDGREILRIAVTRRGYFLAQLRDLSVMLALLGAMGFGARYYREASRRRRFDRLVNAMTRIVQHTGTREELIQALPVVTGAILELDGVAIYLRDGNSIVPKAVYSKSADAAAFLGSTDEEQIAIDDDYPESLAMRENRLIVVSGARPFKKFHFTKFKAAGSHPYIIAPISRHGEAPIGLLTAQRFAGLQREHQSHLRSCAELAALQLENIRGREALERMYRQMIRSTRTVTLGTVVPNIAHNMRTPLVTIGELVRSIAEDVDTINRCELKQRLADIEKSRVLCFEEIDSISRYRKLGSSPARTVDLRNGMERVCGFLHGYFRIKGIDLQQRFLMATSPVIAMQELDFLQVMTNLLTNADEAFTELLGGGDQAADRRRFKIEVVVEANAAGDGVLISIADNGPGIRPEILDRIFEQDFTTKSEGTGAGLPYCKHVVEEAHGSIKAESTLGEGTTFTISLPDVMPYQAAATRSPGAI